MPFVHNHMHEINCTNPDTNQLKVSTSMYHIIEGSCQRPPTARYFPFPLHFLSSCHGEGYSHKEFPLRILSIRVAPQMHCLEILLRCLEALQQEHLLPQVIKPETPKSDSDVYQRGQSLALLQVLVPLSVMLRAPATVMRQIFLNAPANEGIFRAWRGTWNARLTWVNRKARSATQPG